MTTNMMVRIANIIAAIGFVAILFFGGFLALSNINLESRLSTAQDNFDTTYQRLLDSQTVLADHDKRLIGHIKNCDTPLPVP